MNPEAELYLNSDGTFKARCRHWKFRIRFRQKSYVPIQCRHLLQCTFFANKLNEYVKEYKRKSIVFHYTLFI